MTKTPFVDRKLSDGSLTSSTKWHETKSYKCKNVTRTSYYYKISLISCTDNLYFPSVIFLYYRPINMIYYSVKKASNLLIFKRGIIKTFKKFIIRVVLHQSFLDIVDLSWNLTDCNVPEKLQPMIGEQEVGNIVHVPLAYFQNRLCLFVNIY